MLMRSAGYLVVCCAAPHAQGVIATFAGTDWVFRGNGKPALNAPLGTTNGVTVDQAGNPILVRQLHRLRRYGRNRSGRGGRRKQVQRCPWRRLKEPGHGNHRRDRRTSFVRRAHSGFSGLVPVNAQVPTPTGDTAPLILMMAGQTGPSSALPVTIGSLKIR